METVTLKTFDNYFSANIILTRMQAAGINCYLKDEHTVTIDPLLTVAIGGIKLAVDTRQVIEATALLAEFHHEELSEAICPVCKKNEIAEISLPVKNILSGMFSRLFSGYTIPHETWFECGQCHWKSRVLADAEMSRVTDN